MQLRSKRAKHQTAKQTHSSPCSLSLSLSPPPSLPPSLIVCTSALKRKKPSSFPFHIVSEIFNQFSVCFLGIFFLNLSLSLENLQHLRINIILLLTSIVVSLSQSGWLNRFVFFQIVSYLQ